jgi:hypothetical protein
MSQLYSYHSIRVSPGAAGCVTNPAIEFSEAARVPSRLTAMASPIPYCVLKMAGEADDNGTIRDGDEIPSRVTTTAVLASPLRSSQRYWNEPSRSNSG